MMLKPQKTARPRSSAAGRLPFAATCKLIVGCVSILFATSGCRQAGAPVGGAGMAPISGMPGQMPMTGPTMPALGPFGASARVPPPATGSYGNPNGQSLGGTNAMPANYAPPNIAPMSFNDANGTQGASGTSGVATAGFSDPQSNGSTPASAAWQETSAYPAATPNPLMDLSRDTVSTLRSGGMQVSDLTGAPSPPGYPAMTNPAPINLAPMNYANPVGTGAAYAPNPQAANLPNFNPQIASSQSYVAEPTYPQGPVPSAPYPSTTLMPMPSTNPSANNWTSPPMNSPGPAANQPSTTAPISGGGFVDASPAANQPSMSTADRPVQWQTPRR